MSKDRTVTMTFSVNGIPVLESVHVLNPRMWNADDWSSADVVRVDCVYVPPPVPLAQAEVTDER